MGIECAETTCSAQKHHYDECVARVTAAQETEEGTKEDCVEECKFYSLLERQLHWERWLIRHGQSST